MKIEDEKSFALKEVTLRRNVLVADPSKKRKDGDTINAEEYHVAREFIRYYETGNFGNTARDPRGNEVDITIGLCILEKTDLWKNVALKIKTEGWFAASLILWNLYIQDEKKPIQNQVTILGTLYRDENFFEWVPLVRHRSRWFFKTTTEVSLKPSVSLNHPKARIILVAKIEKETGGEKI